MMHTTKIWLALALTMAGQYKRSFVAASQQEVTQLRMPDVAVDAPETYLCHALPLDELKEHWITGFEPHSSMDTAHHMLLFGCAEPGSQEDVWECGEMAGGDGRRRYAQAPVCADGMSIVYAWARDAPALTLPEGVGFKVGGASATQYLVLQVHYMHAIPAASPDTSGIALVSTDEPMPRTAATMLLATDGVIKAGETENFETACEIDEPVEMHPFAFRVHAHVRGKVVSGWHVTTDAHGANHWHLLGKRDPMDPEMFYPVSSKKTIREGDIVAARCHMQNKEDHDIKIGATGADEMCNFYMMYWTDARYTLSDNTCMSAGPPAYYWGKQGGLNNIPDTAASTL